MHSYTGKNKTRFFFNGDFSDIKVVKPMSSEIIDIDSEDLLEFARLVAKLELISMIENLEFGPVKVSTWF